MCVRVRVAVLVINPHARHLLDGWLTHRQQENLEGTLETVVSIIDTLSTHTTGGTPTTDVSIIDSRAGARRARRRHIMQER